MNVTRNVDPLQVDDLRTDPPRACLAVIRDGRTRVLPVRARAWGEEYLVEVREGDAEGLDGADVQLVADDGVGWFELRTLAVRGTCRRTGPHDADRQDADRQDADRQDAGQPDAGQQDRDGDRRVRLTLIPRRQVAWDYASLRPVPEAEDPTDRDGGPRPAATTPASARRGAGGRPSRPDPGEWSRPDPRGRPGPGRRAARFIRRSRVVIVGTTSGRPMAFATPLWFAPHRGLLYLTTGGASWAGRNVDATPEVCLLFGGERGRADRGRLQVDGVAELRPGLPPAPAVARLVLRYYLTPRRALTELRHLRLWRYRRRYYAQSEGGPGHLVVRVTRARFLPGSAP